LNLFGAGGQLLLFYYGLSAISPAGIVSPEAGSLLPYLALLIGVAMIYYVGTRFQLVGQSAKPGLRADSATSSPMGSGMF
jgi:hypothetical protein